MPQRISDWLRQAHAELEAARSLSKDGHWAWTCFTCHQSAEKALKAVCEKLRVPRFGHNLNTLMEEIGVHVDVSSSIRDAARRLNRFYIPTRYPDAFPEGAPADQFFEADAGDALTAAERILRWADNQCEDVDQGA